MADSTPRKPAGGVAAVTVTPAGNLLRAAVAADGRAEAIFRDATQLTALPLAEQRSSYAERLDTDAGPQRVRHTLTLVVGRETFRKAFTPALRRAAETEGLIALVTMASGERLLAGWSARFGTSQPLRPDSFAMESGIKPLAGRPDAYERGHRPGRRAQRTRSMSRKQKFKPAVAVANRADDPYITSGAGSVQSDKFWRWGDDNLFPNALALMARRSVTHRRIINDKADYISGKGFSCDEGHEPLLAAFIRRVNGDGESLRQVLNKLAFDKALFGNAFLEIVTDAEHSFLAFHHQDASRCRVARDSAHILLHHDWAAFNAAEARTLPLYPAFERQEDGTLRAMIHYKDYEPMFEHYGVPPYIAGFNVSAIAYKTDKWNISRLDNSFQLSGVMMLDSTVDNESEAERIVRLAEQKFAGNPGQVMFVIRDGGESDNSRFIPIASQNEGDWQALHEQAVSDIVVAHSWFRTLSGLDYASGFSAERILHEYEVALNTVILGEQAELTEPVREAITSILGIDASSLQVINRPPTRSKPIYMKVWEARKADGLDYDPDDERQQAFLSEITKYNIRSIE